MGQEARSAARRKAQGTARGGQARELEGRRTLWAVLALGDFADLVAHELAGSVRRHEGQDPVRGVPRVADTRVEADIVQHPHIRKAEREVRHATEAGVDVQLAVDCAAELHERREEAGEEGGGSEVGDREGRAGGKQAGSGRHTAVKGARAGAHDAALRV